MILYSRVLFICSCNYLWGSPAGDQALISCSIKAISLRYALKFDMGVQPHFIAYGSPVNRRFLWCNACHDPRMVYAPAYTITVSLTYCIAVWNGNTAWSDSVDISCILVWQKRKRLITSLSSFYKFTKASLFSTDCSRKTTLPSSNMLSVCGRLFSFRAVILFVQYMACTMERMYRQFPP